MGRARDSNSREELHHMLPAQFSVPDFTKYCERSESPSGSSSVSSSSGDNALWNEDFSHRPTWCDAGLAYQQMKKGRAKGCRAAIRIRATLQRFLFWLGCCIQRHYYGVLTVGLLVLSICTIGLVKTRVETNIEKLWVEKGGRLDTERDFIRSVFSHQLPPGVKVEDGGFNGGGNSAQYLVLIQTPRRDGVDILTQEDLLLHAEVLKNVSQLTVDMYGEKWKLSDICFKPAAPAIESTFGDMVKSLLDRIIPCIIITPLDCFWDGSAPLGPFPPMNVPAEVTMFIPSLKGRLTWKNLDPLAVVQDAANMLGDAEGIKNLFARAGVEDGYLSRPCIDPLDPECPHTAPNYLDMCFVVEKYLKFTNQSHIDSTTSASTTTTQSTAILDDGSNTTALNMSDPNEPQDGKALNIWHLFWPSSEKERHKTISSLPPEICDRYSDEVRRLVRADKSLLSRLGIAEKKVNFGQELTGGCRGFAQNYMHWPEDLIVGGVRRQSDQIIKADALQTVLMISSPTDIYYRFKEKGGYKSRLHTDTWSYEAADNVLKKWQRKYTDYIYNAVNNTQDERRLHPLAGTSVNDMLAEFSRFNPMVILVGYVLMILYAAVSLCSCAERGVRSSVGLAVSGCLMVTLASVAGLGLSMFMGVPFNAATTQIVPFLTLGLGVDDMFLLVHNYREIVKFVHRDEIGFLLKETGLSALLTSINNIVAFLAGSIMPVPALRDFCLQVAILLCFNAVTVLTIYPAIMTIDLGRRRRKMVDIFCCIKNDKIQPRESSIDLSSSEVNGDFENTDLSRRLTDSNNDSGLVESGLSNSSSPIMGNGSINGEIGGKRRIGNTVSSSDHQLPIHKKAPRRSLRQKCGIQHWTLHRFVRDVYIPLLSKRNFKACVVLLHCALCALGVIGFTRVSLGLELTDVIPKGTAPYAFLDAREKYFSFYPFNIVIKGPTDYANHQRLMRDFREEISSISYVVKNSDRQLPEESWLAMMAKWLGGLQAKLDEDMHNGRIAVNGAVKAGASKEGMLAFKLLCNRGDTVDCSRVGKTKLIDRDGMIEPEGFYNYITAWANMDPMSYYISQANFYPAPPHYQDTEKMNDETDFKVPPTSEIMYSQLPFFATDLVDTPATVDMIRQIRDLCDRYVALGLPVFPEGIPFTFWEQYLHLWKNLGMAVGIITGAVLLIVTALLMSPWTAVIVVIVLALMVVELAGFMGLMGLKLNPVSSVTLITAVGIGVEFTVHVSLSFLTALGSRNERMGLTLEHMFIPVLHGGLSTLLGVIMLAFSEFEFVVRYFFMVMSALIVLGLLNGLLLLPVLLSLIGPPSEVRPTDGSNRLSLPTPSPQRRKSLPQMSHAPANSIANNSLPTTPIFHSKRSNAGFHCPSLSTIAEEQTTPPSSVTPPAVTGEVDASPTITLGGMKLMVHGGAKMDSPMTLKAKAKLQLQVIPGAGSNGTRRSTIAACDAPPPPYSNNISCNQPQPMVDTNDGNRRRNRSAGSAPSISSPNGLQRRMPSSASAVAAPFSPPSPLQQPAPRRRIPSDPSAMLYDGIGTPPAVMRY